MKKIHLIKQHDEKDCGVACLSMILSFYGKKIPMAKISEAIKVDKYGANIYGIIEGAKKYNLTATALGGEFSDVLEAIQTNEITLPAIIRIVNQKGYEHFVVVTKYKNNKIYVCDPDKGKYKLSVEQISDCFLGQIIIFSKDDNFKKENLCKGKFLRFTKLIFKQKFLLFIVAILSLIITSIGILGTFLFQYIIDNIVYNLQDLEKLDESVDILAVLIAGIGIMYLIKLLVQILRGRLLAFMSKRIDMSMVLEYYNHIVSLPLSFFDTRKTGDIISRFSDSSKIRDAISGATLTLMIDIVMVIISGFILYRKSTSLFMVAVGIFVAYFLVALLYIKPLDKINRQVMVENAEFNSYIKETIDGIETVKTLKAEESAKSKIQNMFDSLINKSIKGSMLSIRKDSIVDFITSIGILVLLWCGTIDVVNGVITAGTLITVYAMISYFISPVQNIVELQSNIQTAIVAADRLNDILDLEKEEDNNYCLDSYVKNIELRNISFRYGNRNEVLKNISLNINSGEHIAIVGLSGCGKSTVSKLLFGFYKADSGELLINGVSIEQISKKCLRERIAYVPQKTFLFSGSIKDNLLLGVEESNKPSDEELSKILDLCFCDFVKSMPLGIDSIVEENGANLSGGQCQRLSIARALINRPQVLILDEAMSALDTISERKIYNNIINIYSDIILITVSHRLNTIRDCDKIFVIDDGIISEYGNHSELIERNNIYAQLWKQQNNY